MIDKQPDPLFLADQCEAMAAIWANEIETRLQAAALLRTQHTEIERLTSCLKWEQNRAERIGTHGPGCEKWGSAHFECALRAIERKDALLRKCLKHVASNITRDGCEAEELFDDITKELSQ